MMWANEGWWGIGWAVHWIVSAGFLVLLVWVIVALTRIRNDGGSADRSLAILKERYAKGELTLEQFNAMRREIDS